tara:strand:- start:29872 stop:31038 length:1167 start_codon:yes stop_codon:yes gene_type:complete
MKKLFKLIIFISLYPLKKIILPKDIIILSSSSPYVYGGGPKSLFEFLSKKGFNVYWYTEDKNIKKYLIKKKFKYLSISNPFLFFKIIFLTKIIINSGNDHFDFCNLLKKDKRVKKICTGHGIGLKTVNKIKTDALDINFDYVSYPSKYVVKNIAQKHFKISLNKIKILGNPKNDLFFNKSKVNNIYRNKKNIKSCIKKLDKKSKIIFYAPTWRPYKSILPLLSLKKFDLEQFELFLKKNNFYFIYKLHTLSNYGNILDTERIKFISDKNSPYLNTSEMLCECDIFCTDCSSVSTEAAILKKPQIIIFPDYKKYDKIKGFVEPFDKYIPGNIIYDFNLFLKTLNSYKKEKIYIKEFDKKINKYLDHYYDIKINNSSVRHEKLITQLLKN